MNLHSDLKLSTREQSISQGYSWIPGGITSNYVNNNIFTHPTKFTQNHLIFEKKVESFAFSKPFFYLIERFAKYTIVPFRFLNTSAHYQLQRFQNWVPLARGTETSSCSCSCPSRILPWRTASTSMLSKTPLTKTSSLQGTKSPWT